MAARRRTARVASWWLTAAGPILAAMLASSGEAANLSGVVFEDPNYGGGSGRSLAASAGVVRSGARVELHDGAGNFVTSTTTTAVGSFTFAGLGAGGYTVRVVNSTVTSSRTGYVAGLLPVQTFRTDAASGAAVAVTNRVGGEDPTKVDAGNGSTTLAALTTATTTAQSITAVTLGASNIGGLDFRTGPERPFLLSRLAPLLMIRFGSPEPLLHEMDLLLGSGDPLPRCVHP